MEAGATLTPAQSATQDSPSVAPVSPKPASPAGRGAYVCPTCGHQLRVFGGGRHRVYFPLENTRLDDPVMDGRCPECGAGLPGKQ